MFDLLWWLLFGLGVFVDIPAFDIPLLLSYGQKIADIAWKLTTSAGVVVGGTWAYFKFVRGRTFKPNLVPKVAGETRYKNGEVYLIVTTEVENAGASKVSVNHQYTVIRVFTATPISGFEGPIGWTHFQTERILGHHKHLEPGGSAVDTTLFRIQCEGCIALRLEVGITSTKRDNWTAVGIVNLVEGVDNVVVSGEGS